MMCSTVYSGAIFMNVLRFVFYHCVHFSAIFFVQLYWFFSCVCWKEACDVLRIPKKYLCTNFLNFLKSTIPVPSFNIVLVLGFIKHSLFLWFFPDFATSLWRSSVMVSRKEFISLFFFFFKLKQNYILVFLVIGAPYVLHIGHCSVNTC